MTTSIRVLGQEATISAVDTKEEQDRSAALTSSYAADVPSDSEQDTSAQGTLSVTCDEKESAVVQAPPNS